MPDWAALKKQLLAGQITAAEYKAMIEQASQTGMWEQAPSATITPSPVINPQGGIGNVPYMPGGAVPQVETPVVEKSLKDFHAFLDWYKATYPGFHHLSFTYSNYQTQPEYSLWLKTGKAPSGFLTPREQSLEAKEAAEWKRRRDEMLAWGVKEEDLPSDLKTPPISDEDQTPEETAKEKSDKLILEGMIADAQRKAELLGTPFPGGVKEFAETTFAGQRGYWVRDPDTGSPVFVPLGAEKEAVTPPTKPLTKEEASAILAGMGPGFRLDYNETTGGWEVNSDPYFQKAETPEERAQREYYEAQTGQIGKPTPPTQYLPYGTSPYDIPSTSQIEGQFNPYTGQWEQPAGWISPADQAQIQYNKDYLAWMQTDAANRLEAQKQERLATLQAHPASWLQYAIESKTPAVAQPWMMPLAPEQYGFQMGQPIPQFNPENLRGLPQLTTPSRQYQARMSPSSQQQYYGYEQARSGATPEDIQWRLWSQAPPSGRSPGLQWQR